MVVFAVVVVAQYGVFAHRSFEGFQVFYPGAHVPGIVVKYVAGEQYRIGFKGVYHFKGSRQIFVPFGKRP